jgi:hypothetical protein
LPALSHIFELGPGRPNARSHDGPPQRVQELNKQILFVGRGLSTNSDFEFAPCLPGDGAGRVLADEATVAPPKPLDIKSWSKF